MREKEREFVAARFRLDQRQEDLTRIGKARQVGREEIARLDTEKEEFLSGLDGLRKHLADAESRRSELEGKVHESMALVARKRTEVSS